MFKKGDRVAYSADWLRNTGQQAGEAAFARGTVTSVSKIKFGGHPLINIKWDGAGNKIHPTKVLAPNLAKVGGPGFSARNPGTSYQVLGRGFDTFKKAELFAQQMALTYKEDVSIMEKVKGLPWHEVTVIRHKHVKAYNPRGRRGRKRNNAKKVARSINKYYGKLRDASLRKHYSAAALRKIDDARLKRLDEAGITRTLFWGPQYKKDLSRLPKRNKGKYAKRKKGRGRK